uniref:G_PROTEIN_RECEP_F1_2 domain-containing protein n=1 Tax=Panagrellus redivivus TaxID=6233 RepID=A0A7E4VQU0_PANRE
MTTMSSVMYEDMVSDDIYSLAPTFMPNHCLVAFTSQQNKTLRLIEHLRIAGIVAQWPNFTNCLPECGICSDFPEDSVYVAYNFIVIGVILPFIGLCGLCGNSISAFIYSRPNLRSWTNLYLCCLECSDIAVICTALVMFFLDSIRRYSLQLSLIYGVFASVAYPAGLIAQTCSVYFTLAAAVNCFVEVCLPERCQRWLNHTWVFQMTVLSIITFSIAYNIPRFFESFAFECWNTPFDSSLMEVCPTPMRFNQTYTYVYYYILYTVFLAVGPLVVLIILNTCIIVASVVFKKGNTDDNISLILVVLLFISCNTIALLLNIFEEKLEGLLQWRVNYLVDVSNLLVVFNSSFNFIIYYTFSKPFRRTFQNYFFPNKDTPNKRSENSTKALLVKDSEQNFESNNSIILLSTSRLNELGLSTQIAYEGSQNGINNDVGSDGGNDTEQRPPPSPPASPKPIITNGNSAQMTITRLGGVSRTEVLI